jgi:hypothetical protein
MSGVAQCENMRGNVTRPSPVKEHTADPINYSRTEAQWLTRCWRAEPRRKSGAVPLQALTRHQIPKPRNKSGIYAPASRALSFTAATIQTRNSLRGI